MFSEYGDTCKRLIKVFSKGRVVSDLAHALGLNDLARRLEDQDSAAALREAFTPPQSGRSRAQYGGFTPCFLGDGTLRGLSPICFHSANGTEGQRHESYASHLDRRVGRLARSLRRPRGGG